MAKRIANGPPGRHAPGVATPQRPADPPPKSTYSIPTKGRRMTAPAEEELARFSGWYHNTSIALEYWEVLVTSRRVIFCFVGQSYRSLLLKADMGASHRDRVASMEPNKVAEFDEQNVVVPLSELGRITLTRPTRFRTAILEFEWTEDSMTLRRKGPMDEDAAALSTLEADDRFDHVTITRESQSLLPWR